ncbi:hypothetical protein BEP19_08900 [Ammoniphilus oxalaticus]|uniref:ABC-2 type transporter transmembrane domain-containing protein n=1 Tax=Ammoniphilus oxalaticus TaxID=66863 RepID=A0A419SKI7_9BACL|nr:ABC transporter permease [Ammoniphilus oxalaticus]RKD24492.1 hypothetical protein BEP19_08900 [Ammoniphilus oxalaticus]
MVSKSMMEEWVYLWKNKRLLVILLLVPFVFTVLFGAAYSEGKLHSLPTVYFDEDQSALSRQVIQAFQASETFEIVAPVHSEAELSERIQQGQATLGIVLPSGMEKRVRRGETGQLLTFVDGSNLAVVNSALQGANEVVQTISGGIAIKRMEAKGIDQDTLFSLRSGYRMLYNPTLHYGIFMPLGLVSAAIQQALMLGIALCIVRHREKGNAGVFVERLSEVGVVRWLYAKSMPYFLIGIIQFGLCFALLINKYHFPFVGQAGWMLVLSIVFMVSLLGLGLLVSAFTPDRLQATQISMLIALLSFPLSGYTWPFIAMPDALVFVGRLMPLTYFLHGVQEIALKGHGWAALQSDLIALGLISAVTFSLTAFRLFRQKAMQKKSEASNELPELENSFQSTI